MMRLLPQNRLVVTVWVISVTVGILGAGLPFALGKPVVVKGNSMANTLREGDIVFGVRSFWVKPGIGDVVVLDGYLKRWICGEDMAVLCGDNYTTSVIIVIPHEKIGYVVVGMKDEKMASSIREELETQGILGGFCENAS